MSQVEGLENEKTAKVTDTAAEVEEEAEEVVEGTEMEAESGGTEVAARGDTVLTLTKTEVDNGIVLHRT
ncbi:hypothetical protein fugu_011115 [Takifugu bimaculatus]|uniref:Uncharacterized protein n=1 Tax=Takifugu bimaculatus TaxID=433685 RepID=A0A4Z2CC09_9TELE|nr:hypothetical protein fugu_011115 [Takifugu bimaculatus]